MRGFDAAFDTRPVLLAAQRARYRFAGRYLCERNPTTGWKIITPGEAAAVLDAGLELVLFWEWYETRISEGYDAGCYDSEEAQRQLDALGLPAACVLYACDYDAPPGHQAAINAYLDGAATNQGDRGRGLYGGYYPVHRALDAGVVVRAAQTYAWSGYTLAPAHPPAVGKLVTAHLPQQVMGPLPAHTVLVGTVAGQALPGQFLFDDRAALRQGPTVTLAGHTVDADETVLPDYGQWPRPPQAHKDVETMQQPGFLSDDGPATPLAFPNPPAGQGLRLRFATNTGDAQEVRADWLGVDQPTGSVVISYSLGPQGLNVPDGCRGAVVHRNIPVPGPVPTISYVVTSA